MKNRDLIEVALLTATAIILTMISIPVPLAIFTQFGLKLDLSVIFIFLIFYRQGFKMGMIGITITMIFNAIVGPTPYLIGEFTYILAFLTFYATYRDNRAIRAVVATSIIMTIANFFIITPVYTMAYGGMNVPYFQYIFNPSYIKLILITYPAFNLLQWSVNGFIIDHLVDREKKN